LMNLIFERPAHGRTISFQEIADRTKLELDKIEWLLMRAMSLGLIKGIMDEVEQVIYVKWVQPRVLDAEQQKQLCTKENKRRLEGLYSISSRKLASIKKTPMTTRVSRSKTGVDSDGDLKSCVVTMKKILQATTIARQQMIQEKKSRGEKILDF